LGKVGLMGINSKRRRRHTVVAAGSVLATAGVIHLACSVNITPVPGGSTAVFSLAGATIGIALGPAGVFVVETGRATTNVADIAAFSTPPEGEPISAVVRIEPSDVTFFSPSADGTISDVTLFPSSADRAIAPNAQTIGIGGQMVTSTFFLDAFVVDADVAIDACESEAASSLMSYTIGVVDSQVVSVERFDGGRFSRGQLSALLSNNFRICLRISPPIDDEPNPAAARGTLMIEGLLITFGGSLEPSFTLTDADPGETQACCWPPLLRYWEFDEPRRQICEDIAFDSTAGSPREHCETRGGGWKGKGSSCADLTCDEDFRVCCRGSLSGEPCMEFTEEFCVGRRGVAFPPGRTCADENPFPCDEPVHACCFDEEDRCRDVPDGAGCPVGSVTAGEGTKCADCPCANNEVCRQETELTDFLSACCRPGLPCVNMTPENCGLADGFPLIIVACAGDGSTCTEFEPPPTGVCCLPESCVADVTEEACREMDELAKFAEGLTECPCKGACCVPDSCVPDVTEAQCLAMDDLAQYAGDLSECPCKGACCTSLNCAPDVTEGECMTIDDMATYAGDLSECPCKGACCDDFGNCDFVTESDCTGRYQGDTVACLPENPCEILVGGCCDGSGNCTLTLEGDCTAPSTFFGRGVDCPPPGECPVGGACCILNADGQASHCVDATEQDCNDNGGLLFEAGTACTTDSGDSVDLFSCPNPDVPRDCDAPDCPGVCSENICFAQGEISFADSVITYEPTFGGFKKPSDDSKANPETALGEPDYNAATGTSNAVSIGQGGKLELAFTDNLATNSGDYLGDLYVFEVGAAVEATIVSLRATEETAALLAAAGFTSDNGWYVLQRIEGSTREVDLDSVFPGFSPGALKFDAVQLIDDKDQGPNSPATPGADIDAVGAIATVPFGG